MWRRDVALKAAPGKLRHAFEAWHAMSEGQREAAESTQGPAKLGCAGHSVNLTIEDPRKKSERESPETKVRVQEGVQRKARASTAWAPGDGEWEAAFGAVEAKPIF